MTANRDGERSIERPEQPERQLELDSLVAIRVLGWTCCADPTYEWRDRGAVLVYNLSVDGVECVEIEHTRRPPVWARCVSCGAKKRIAELKSTRLEKRGATR